FGLPPGITREQWPLDPNNGYPLMHGFTLLLPENYRVHGPENVALSFFATAPDHCDGAFFEVEGARSEVEAREDWTGDSEGYQSYFYWAEDPTAISTDTEEGRQRIQDAFRIRDWAKDHKDAHIGGTMRPVQNIPAFSPYYVEFDEYFGGYNFGGGNAQLDFRDMKFDWACG
ncbi:MAG: hypothetical protein ABW206_13155, partial [Agrobacterium vaccinii]